MSTNATNVVVLVTLLTNSMTWLHPSGIAGYQTNVVYQSHSVAYALADKPFVMTSNVPISTNVSVMHWLPLPERQSVARGMRPPRDPMAIPDVVRLPK